MKERISYILLFLFSFINSYAQLQLSYAEFHKDVNSEIRVCAMLREKLLDHYGKDWYFKNIIYYGKKLNIKVLIGRGNELKLTVQGNQKLYNHEFMNVIKELLDSLATNKAILYSPYITVGGEKIDSPNKLESEKASVIMLQNVNDYLFEDIWDFAVIYKGGLELENMMSEGFLYYGFSLNLNDIYVQDISHTEHHQFCINPLSDINYDEYKLYESTKSQIDYTIDFIKEQDKYILMEKEPSEYYMVRFTYSPEKYTSCNLIYKKQIQNH